MKKLPIGIQTFSEIRENNYAYVDKTGIAVDLIERYKYVFLSRPRRFGKSLFVDTLHNLFGGTKELFISLAAEKSHDWSKTYPVIRISFSEGSFRSPKALDQSLLSVLEENENRLDVQGKSKVPAIRFAQLIREASGKYSCPVVILIDEYDKPILDNIDSRDMAKEARDSLRDLYSSIKSNDAYIRFAFLTGVSKFSKVSIFSGINNIEDITLTPEFSTICGYTQKDLDTVFVDHLQGADMEQVKLWYDGYHFLGENVYNPFDILLFLRNSKQFKNYWFESGTPTFLVKLLQKQRFFLPQISKIKTGEELISSFDIDNINPIPLLFQAGYLTIKDVLQVGVITQYTLGFPNLEVKSAFNNSLVDLFFPSLRKNEVQTDIYLALYNGDLDKFKSAVHALFAAIPYHNYTNNEIARYEGFYASVIYAWLASSRLSLTVEDCTNKGRIDMSVDMEDAIYLIEFKVDQEGKALEQIRAKNYPEKFLAKSMNGSKEIVLIGIGFSSVEKNVTEFVWEKVAMD